MRIVHMVADGRPGGATSLVLDLLETQAARPDTQVGLIVQEGSYAFDRARALGVGVEGVPFFGSAGWTSSFRSAAHATGRLRPDVLHVHGSRAAFVAWVGGFLSTATVYTVHGYHFVHRAWFRRSAATFVERRIGAHVGAVVFVSAHDANLAHRLRLTPTSTQTCVIPNGVDSKRVPRAGGTVARTIGVCGRLVHQKDPHLALEVAAALAPRGYRTRFVGGGELEPSLRERSRALALGDAVEFLGEVPRERALEALQDVSVLLLTSRWEGLPIIVIEAMHMGIPIVASRASGLDELLEHGHSGLLVEPREASQFVAAIQRLTADPGLRARIIDEARRVAADRFDLGRVVKSYAQLYDRVATGS